MSWVDRNLPWLLLALLVATTLAVVGTVGVGVVVLVQGLLAGVASSALLGDLAVVVGALTLLGALDAVFAISLVVTAVRRASFPTSERIATAVESAERLLPPLRRLGLAQRFAPSVEDRRRRLQQRYLDGELSEIEFERRLDDLLDAAEDGPASPDRVGHSDDSGARDTGRQSDRSAVEDHDDGRAADPSRVREEE